MNETNEEDEHSYSISRNRFVVMIIGTVLVSSVLVVIAMILYSTSGAAQVDLSRPGYKDVRGQAKEEDQTFDGFSASGPINEGVLSEFERLFNERTRVITENKVFKSDVLNDEALGIDAK